MYNSNYSKNIKILSDHVSGYSVRAGNLPAKIAALCASERFHGKVQPDESGMHLQFSVLADKDTKESALEEFARLVKETEPSTSESEALKQINNLQNRYNDICHTFSNPALSSY